MTSRKMTKDEIITSDGKVIITQIPFAGKDAATIEYSASNVHICITDDAGKIAAQTTIHKHEAVKVAAALVNMSVDNLEDSVNWERHTGQEASLLEKAAYYAYRLLITNQFPWSLLSEEAKQIWRDKVLADEPFHEDIRKQQDEARRQDVENLLANLHETA